MRKCFMRAREARHRWITVDRLLLPLLRDPSLFDHFEGHRVAVMALCEELEEQLSRPVLASPADRAAEPEPTMEFQRTIQEAIPSAQNRGEKEITPVDVFNVVLAHPERLAPGIGERLRSIGLPKSLKAETRLCGLCGKRRPIADLTTIPQRGVLCSDCVAAVLATKEKGKAT
jgi:ATP-dependent Clp protease ATP-binding subunit ClpA